ncbi:hypothetical protein BDD12DRAFT_432181 [Trichophaea hybrida]|nr:hypothetical protein BDD12DRAFT_432181 [Trichophaea hybrida]
MSFTENIHLEQTQKTNRNVPYSTDTCPGEELVSHTENINPDQLKLMEAESLSRRKGKEKWMQHQQKLREECGQVREEQGKRRRLKQLQESRFFQQLEDANNYLTQSEFHSSDWRAVPTEELRVCNQSCEAVFYVRAKNLTADRCISRSFKKSSSTWMRYPSQAVAKMMTSW